MTNPALSTTTKVLGPKDSVAPSREQTREHYLSPEALSPLNQKSNVRGFLQCLGHLAVLGFSGWVWLMPESPWGLNVVALKVVALILYGFSLATMFAPVHECCHRTVFTHPRLNDFVAWWAGVLSFYNSTFYRRYHKWHHRYTRLAGRDPELEDPSVDSLLGYVLQISGWNWWIGKIQGHWQIATGQMDDCPYISESARPEVKRSTQLQLVVYGGAIALSIALGHPAFFWMAWVLPLAIGQPFLRLILLAEHTGCSEDSNPLSNTRTTLTSPVLRWMMWNMSFHAEHHLYPSIPFHQLPLAHEQLKPKFAFITPGYSRFHQSFIATLLNQG